jgi:hypothetical protein
MAETLKSLGLTQRDVQRQPEVMAAKLALARRVKKFWQEIAPVESGEYRQSIKVRVVGTDVRVRADAGHAHLVEYGTGRGDAQYVRAKVQARFGGYGHLE